MDFAHIAKLVGQNVRRARWLRGLTQEQVAAKGFNYRFLQELERGMRNPSLRTLVELARALDVSVMDLVDVGEPRMNPPLSKRKLTPPARGRKPSASVREGRSTRAR